jgi:hypothetical protein
MPNMLKQQALFVHNCLMTFLPLSSDRAARFDVPFDLDTAMSL